jgi:hypothetical protein
MLGLVVDSVCPARGWREEAGRLICECRECSRSGVKQRRGEAKGLRGGLGCWVEIFMFMTKSVFRSRRMKNCQRNETPPPDYNEGTIDANLLGVKTTSRP